MEIAEQTERLLALVEENQRQECRSLLDQARAKRRQLIDAAHQSAREHVHETVGRERARAISCIRSAEAELHTRRRAQAQRVAESLLAEGWTLLEQSLRKRWLDTDGRRAWIQRCAQEAVLRLPSGHWRVGHPGDCAPADLSLFSGFVAGQSPGTEVEMAIVAELEAGMVISIDRTSLDMSLGGFTRDRVNIEGRILALLHEVSDT